VLEDLRGLPGAVQQVLDEEDQVREAAREYGDGEAFFFVGRALGVPVALEGALKLKEISYDHAGVRRGGAQTRPVGVGDARDARVGGVDGRIAGRRDDEQRHRGADAGAPALGCVSAGDEYDTLDVSFEVPDVGVVEPLVANVYLQLFAYHVANDKGRAIDKAAKSGEERYGGVTRFVGVSVRFECDSSTAFDGRLVEF